MAGNIGGFTISVEGIDGTGVGDVPCRAVPDITWGRESNEVSRCQLSVVNSAAEQLIENIRPWYHWVSVWDGADQVWRGPVQRIEINQAQTSIACKDASTYMWRTRVPITRTWTDLDPSEIAAALWTLMMDLHQIRAVPLVLPDVDGESFTVAAVADSRMLNQLMDDLTKIGLRWTVVAGTPVLGPPPQDPVTTLGECDFLAALQIIRDGTGTYNDVRVRGKNFAQTAIIELAGLHLQTLISIDDMFGVSNIQKATLQYAQEVGMIRDLLVVPASASLHPDAPVGLSDLVPGNHFRVDARGLSSLMRLDQMQVISNSSKYDIQVTLETIPDKGEIAKLSGTPLGGGL
jgi:hypothetical protein